MTFYSDDDKLSEQKNILDSVILKTEKENFISKEDEVIDFNENKIKDHDAIIEKAINQLEKALNIKALNDDEWEDMHESEAILHEDIKALDFELKF